MARRLPIPDFAFGIALAFIVGIFAASLAWNLFVVVALCALILISAHYIARCFLWKETAAVLAVLLFGALYYQWYLARDEHTLTLPFNKEIFFTAVVADEPKESGNYETFTVDPWRSHSIFVLAAPNSGFRYGDLLEIGGLLDEPDAPGGDPLIASPKISIIAHHRGFWLREDLINFKEAIIGQYQKFLPPDQAAILGGVTFGGSSGVSDVLKNEMEASGTSYILSMYGYKIAAVTALAAILCENFFSRRITFFISLGLVACFVLMAGLVASAMRAGIMAAIALIAKESGRQVDRRNAIIFTALIMLLGDPTMLMGDAGFQLSCLSILGITYLQKPFKRWWGYDDEGFLGWREGVITTLAVLAPMVPLVSNANGQFPITSIASNLLMFLATPYTLGLGAILAACSFLSVGTAWSIAMIGGIILRYELFVIRLFSFVVIPFPISFGIPLVVALYYAALAIFLFYFYEDE